MRQGRWALVLFALCLLAVLSSALAGRFAAAQTETGSPWTRYQLSGGTITDIDAVSTTDAWVSGGDGIVGHWDGTAWEAVDISKVIGSQAVNTLDMLASNNVWAYASGTYIRYDGTTWTSVPDSVSATMYSISMLSSTDGWTSGANARFGRWDGTNWSEVVASPSVTETMYDLEMFSATDGWAAGGVTIPQVGQQGKIARWNGASWDAVPSSVNNRIFYGIDFSAPNEGWVVGSGGTTQRWNGTSWTLVPPPAVCQLSCGAVTLNEVHSLSPNDAWAVGSTNGWTSNTWHWDGSVWTEINAPTGAPLNSIFMLTSNDGWSVASRGTIYRWNGANWTAATTQWLTNGLYGLDFISPTDGWAVGVLNQTTPPAWGLQHWDGATWTEFQPPSFSPGPMRDVDMLASNQVWAVGSQAAFYWNGATWTVQSSPGNFMDAVSMVSPTDGWAVGTGGDIVHFNGTSWTNYTTPTTTNLWSIDMVDANEGWAGGTLGLMLHYQNGTWTQVTPNPGTTTIEAIQMLNASEGWAVGYGGQILHYTGGTWTPVSSPVTSNLLGIHMIDANEGWAVGVSPTGGSSVIVHYQDGTWTQVNSPTRNNLRDVYVFPDGRGWAVGESPGVKLYLGDWFGGGGTPTPSPTGGLATSTATRTNTPPAATSTSTRTSTALPTNTGQPSPTGTQASTASATTAAASSTATAQATGTAGTTSTATAPATNTVMPSATAEQTATVTSTPGAGSATATPTACALQFTDVPEGHTFYSFIRCLACRGIISGYPCGGAGEPCDQDNNPYFRPGNLITRGQLAKIVAVSAGYSDPVSGQTFEDVQPGTAFYTYTEQLAGDGVMGGYPCGQVEGEPCVPPDNRPYFRPGNNATRGQLTKIVALAAGFNDPAPSTFTFTDVPVGHTFHINVEALLFNRPGVMEGYPCGGPTEPCDDESRPYFRPNNNLTRGQANKIVANTFFPGCETPSR